MSAESTHHTADMGLPLTHFPAMVLTILGGFDLLLASGSAPSLVASVGVVGGLALMAVAWWRTDRLTRSGLLVVGTVPFAALTWWSIVSPLIALLAAGVGCYLIRKPTDGDSPLSTTGLDPK